MISPFSGETSAHARRRRAGLIGIAGIVVVLLAVLAHKAFFSQPSDVAAVDKLTVAIPSAPHAALVHLALAKHYFEDEGLDLKPVSVTHGKLALELLAQGRVDMAAAAELPFAVHVMNGQAFSLVASIASATSEMAVVARRDRHIDGPADLAGKRIGVTLGTSGEYFLWAFLIRHQLAPEAVTLVDIPPERLDAELVRGGVDAIAAWQPTRARAANALGKLGLELVEPNAYTATYVLVGQQNFLQAHPTIPEKLLRALLKAEDFMQRQPVQAQQLVAQRLNVPFETLRPSWGDQDFRVDFLQSQLVTLEEEAHWAVARGYAPPGPAPNFLPHLYLDGLLKVRSERVTVVH